MLFYKNFKNNNNFEYLYNKWAMVFKKYQSVLIDKEVYEWMGKCNIKIIQYATLEQQKKYSELLRTAREEQTNHGINYGVFSALEQHFHSLVMFNKTWYK